MQQTIEMELDGMDVLIEVEGVFKNPAAGRFADSDWDCYGYIEYEYNVFCLKSNRSIAGDLTQEQECLIEKKIERSIAS